MSGLFAHYVLDLGEQRIDGATVFQADPPVPFRLRRLIVSARTPELPAWLCFVVRVTRWIRVPWAVRAWDDNDDDPARERWRLVWRRPSSELYNWLHARRQERALCGAYVRAIDVGRHRLTLKAYDVPAVTYACADVWLDAWCIDAPTARAGVRVRVEFGGRTSVPVTVLAMGFAGEP
jgi:hypothetical protein